MDGCDPYETYVFIYLFFFLKVHRTKSEVLPSRSEEEERRVNDEAAAIVKKLEEKYVSSFANMK